MTEADDELWDSDEAQAFYDDCADDDYVEDEDYYNDLYGEDDYYNDLYGEDDY